jgi:cytochrome c oxidase assembly protein Cox11
MAYHVDPTYEKFCHVMHYGSIAASDAKQDVKQLKQRKACGNLSTAPPFVPNVQSSHSSKLDLEPNL